MKKNKIGICFLILFIHSHTLIAQYPYPSALNPSSHSTTIGAISWDWSLGEQIMVQTLRSEHGYIISTGFLQNDLGQGVDYKLLAESMPFKIGPNPIQQNLRISSDQNGIVISSIEIRDAQAKLFKRVQGPFSGIQFEHTISFISANTGLYFILINYVVGTSISKTKVFKIFKLH